MDAFSGAAENIKTWKFKKSKLFRYKEGFISKSVNNRIKWNVIGKNIRLYSPTGPKFGKGKIIIDGKKEEIIDFHSKKKQKSHIVKELVLELGYHAIILQPFDGNIPCDCIEVQD
jgi:hypothetical protein